LQISPVKIQDDNSAAFLRRIVATMFYYSSIGINVAEDPFQKRRYALEFIEAVFLGPRAPRPSNDAIRATLMGLQKMNSSVNFPDEFISDFHPSFTRPP